MDIYNTEKYYRIEVENIKNWDTSKANKEKIVQFLRKMEINGISIVQLQKYVYALKQFLKVCNKDFELIESKDIDEYLNSISTLKPKTRKIRYYSLKKFFDFVGKAEIFENNGIKFEKIKHKLPEEILSEEEIEQMINSCESLRDKAFISALYESGARIGEFLSLKIKNVEFDKYGAILIVNGKTGQRRIRIIKYASFLLNWVQNHPLKDPEAWLWVTKYSRKGSKKRGWNRLLYEGANLLLRNIAKKCKIAKRVNPHAFRHARATHLANSLTEAQLKELFGWKQSSEMASIYVHLSGRDIDNALLKLHGLKPKEEVKANNIVTCPKCSTINSALQKFCVKCAYPFDDKTERMFEFIIECFKAIGEVFPQAKQIVKNIAKEKRFEGLFNGQCKDTL